MKVSRFIALSIVLLVMVLAFSMQAQADSIYIDNFGFENPVIADNHSVGWVAGWTKIYDGAAGAQIWNPPDYYYSAIPEGQNIIRVFTFEETPMILEQILPDVLSENIMYTLQVDVGNNSPYFSPFENYSVQLLAGGTLLSEENSLLPSDDQFLTSTLTYTASSGNPLIGQQLAIRLTTDYINDFDYVRLNTTVVPEPSTMLLLGSGLFGLGAFRRKFKK